MIRRLVFTRLEDIRGGFEEELKEMKPMKKPLQNTEKLTDSDDEYEVPSKIVSFKKIPVC
uniref:Bm8970 n=1 Tax=Brugia malayi TaxID=6279 RepID=A0A1I9G0D6_BRUMA|nr:Bm8970 [Brugia malayi]